MQINTGGTHSKREMEVTTRDFAVLEGEAGMAVRVAGRMVGFSAEDVDAVSLKVRAGRLHIELQSEQGEALREYRVPSTDVLRNNLQALTNEGLYFSAGEVDELAKLMKLSMSGPVSRQDIVLMLDEISHIAPGTAEAATVDLGDLYPDLSHQVRKLMSVMPDDIQRFVILNNLDHFGDDIWNTFHLISKVDKQRHPAMTRFLAGQAAFNYVTQAELEEIAVNTPLQKNHPVTKVDGAAFQALMRHLNGTEVAGDYRTIHFPEPLAKFIFEHFQVDIPNFAAAESFDALEAHFMANLKATRPLPGKAEDPLKGHLMHFLDTKKYTELADFLGGREGARFTTEAREGLMHFLREPPQDVPKATPLSIGEVPYDRVLRFLRNQKVDITQLLAEHPTSRQREHPEDPVHLESLGKDFRKLPKNQRLAMFVLDHLDPVRHRDLFQYFDGKQAGLAKMTRALHASLEQFLHQGRINEVKGGLTHFVPARFEELAKVLTAFPRLTEPEDFLPANPRLREALFEMNDHEETLPETVEASSEKGLRAAPDRRNTRIIAEQIGKSLQGLIGEPRNTRLTQLLKQHLTHFRQIALLDQTWRAEALVENLLKAPTPTGEPARKLAGHIRNLGSLLAGEDAEIKWDLWKSPEPKPGETTEKINLRKHLLKDHKGPERYLQLDKQVPERAADFPNRVEELSWMRRMEELANRIDRHRGQNPARLTSALKRTQQALRQLSDLLARGAEGPWENHGQSPLTEEKQTQFKAFREAVLSGSKADVAKLFEGPFLKEGFSATAQQQQQVEMKRLEPFFKEAITRFETEPVRVLERLMQNLLRPDEMSRADAGGRLSQLVNDLREFNQHQNLNQQPMYLSLPLKWGERESDMELAYFRLPGGDKERRFLVVVHLDFDTWGHLRVDALKEDDALSATFWVANARMSTHIQRDLDQLKRRLAEQGVGPVTLAVKIERKRAERPVSELCVPSHDGELDMEI